MTAPEPPDYGRIFKVFIALALKFKCEWQIVRQHALRLGMSESTFRVYKLRFYDNWLDQTATWSAEYEKALVEAEHDHLKRRGVSTKGIFDNLVKTYGGDWETIQAVAALSGIVGSTFRVYKMRYQSVHGDVEILPASIQPAVTKPEPEEKNDCSIAQFADNLEPSVVIPEEISTEPPPANQAQSNKEDLQALLHNRSLFFEPGTTKEMEHISWDLIPPCSILERTPRELFALSTERERQLTEWLEKLPVEMIPDASSLNQYIFTNLDLLAISSCSISWLLTHGGEEFTDALFEELRRVILDCIGCEGHIHNLFSETPFLSEKSLYYLVEDYPAGTNAVFLILGKECQANERLASLNEVLLCKSRDLTAATLLELAHLYTLVQSYNSKAASFFKGSLYPEAYQTLSDFTEAWMARHIPAHVAKPVALYCGWNGEAMTAPQIARLLSCCNQNVYNHLKHADEKLSHINALVELRELIRGIFSDVYQRDGICSVDEISQAIQRRYGWSDCLSGNGLVKLIERSKTKALSSQHGWVYITNRACLSEDARSNERWILLENGRTSDEPLHVPSQADEEQEEIPEPDEEAVTVCSDTVCEELKAGDDIWDPVWLESGNFIWLATDALLARAKNLQLLQGRTRWSLIELGFTEQDYETLLSWGSSGTVSKQQLNTRKKVNGVSYSGREAAAFVFIAFAVEVCRREATEGEAWPQVYEKLGSDLSELFMMNQGFNNSSPRPWLKVEMERIFRSYNLRHAFDTAGTYVYLKSIYLQFGFTLKGLQRIPWWLCGQQVTVAIDDLAGDGPNRSDSFVELMRACKEFRWKGLALDEFQRVLQENPWLPPADIGTIVRSVTSKSYLLSQGQQSDEQSGNAATQSSSILGTPRLSIIENQPVFHVSTGDIWPDSLQDQRYVIQFGTLLRVAVERQHDGNYSFAGGDVTLEAVKPSLDVMLFEGGQPKLDEPISYQLWNTEEEFTFYRTNGYRVSEESVRADKTPLFLIAAADIELSATADVQYALFSGSARLHYFKRGIPTGFTLSLDGESFWQVPEAKETVKKTVKPSGCQIQGICSPLPSAWGKETRIRLGGIPSGTTPRRLIIGDMMLHLAEVTGTVAVTESIKVPPGLASLPAKGTLIALEQGQLRRFPVSLVSRFSGVALESPSGWIIPDNRRVLDKSELQSSRILAITSDFETKEWVYTEGERLLARPSPYGDRIGQELMGLGAPLYLRKGPFNSVEEPVEIARSVIDGGMLGGAEPTDEGWRIVLRHNGELTGQFAVHAWYPEEQIPVEVGQDKWFHDANTSSLLVAASADRYDPPCSFSLSYAGVCIGRTWNGHAAFHDLASIITETKDWQTTAAWLAWWHAPVLTKELKDSIFQRIRKQAAETLVAWIGLDEHAVVPGKSQGMTLRMKDAIRTFFHNALPEKSKSAEILLSLGLLTGDPDLDEDDAWEHFDSLLEISPILLVHLARKGTEALYGSSPDTIQDLLRLLRRKVAGLTEMASDSDVGEVEKGLLTTAARVMAVDEQFIQRSVLEEARKLLKSEQPMIRNLDFCLDIQPIRDWITLRLLAS